MGEFVGKRISHYGNSYGSNFYNTFHSATSPKSFWLVLLVSVLGLSFITSNGKEGTFFYSGKWSEASRTAYATQKPIMIFVGAPYCNSSDNMEKVFQSKEVGRFLNAHFVCKKMDAENPLENLRASNWGVTSVPTFLYMNTRHKIVYRIGGYRNKTQILEDAVAALAKIDGK